MRLITTLAATTALGFAAVAFGAGLFGARALAEEQDPPEVQIDAPEVTITGATPSTGVYLRGDLGYTGWTGEGDPMLRSVTGGTVSSSPFDNERFGRARAGGSASACRSPTRSVPI